MSPAPRSPWLCGAAALLAFAASPASAQRVGVSSAVNPAATAAPPGQTERQLLVGENIVFNEHIATSSNGQTQILFVDESAISVGPNSDMTIDAFVYDPKTGTGTEALSATRGVFRYVGGKLSKGTTPVTIKTPAATIGIRGGVFVMDLGSDGTLEVIFLYGNGLTITGLNGVTVTITRPGFGVTVNGRGGSPSNPTRASSGRLAHFITQLDGQSGSNGGASQVPTDTTVADSGVSQTISGNLPGSIQSALQSQQGSQFQQQTQTQTVNPPVQNNLNTTVSQSQPAITQADTNTGPPQNSPSGPPQNSPPGPPQNLTQTGLSGGGIAINTVTHQGGFTSPLVPYANGTAQNGVFMATIGAEQLSLSLDQGTGTLTPTGSTVSAPIAGTAVTTPDGTFFYANLHLVTDPSRVGFVYGGTPVNANAYHATGAPQFLAFQVQPDGVLQSPIPFVPTQYGGSLSNPSVSPLYLAVSPSTGFGTGTFSGSAFPKALQASLAINGTGAGQSSVLLVAVGNAFATTANPGQTTALPVVNGIAEGSYQANGTTPPTRINTALLTGVDGTGNSFYGNNSITGFVLTPNNCCNFNGTQIPGLATATDTQTGASTTYGFVQPAVATTTPAIANGPQTAQALVGLAGGIMTGTQGGVSTPYVLSGGVGIVTDPSNLQVLAAIAGTDTFSPQTGSGVSSVQLSYGSLTPGGTAARQGYINDNLFGALESPGGNGSAVNGVAATRANLYLVDANAVPNNPLLPSTGLCECQYLQWGYWGGEIDTGTGVNARTDIGHINTWVAGVPTPQADLNNLTTLTATANYLGNAIGSVNNNGATYLAAGAFSETYHFGTGTGTLAINNFDGRNFAGTISGATGQPVYAGTLTGTNVAGTTAGIFYGPNAAETGGNFAVHSITGLPYQAGGVFAGKKN